MMTEREESRVGAYLKSIQQRAFTSLYRKTFTVVPADTAERRRQVFNLRYKVYCIENHFLKPSSFADELERDAFDERAFHHLLIHKPTGQAAGTIRVLLPDERRPLLSFEMQKDCNHPLLQIENRVLGLCEISRFCMAADFRRRMRDGRLLPSWYEQEDVGIDGAGRPLFRRSIPYSPLGLLKSAFATVMSNGFHNCVMMIEASQRQSFVNLGFEARNLGPAIDRDGIQQPLIFNIKSVLDKMAATNNACWDVVSDAGRLHRRADELYSQDWHESPNLQPV